MFENLKSLTSGWLKTPQDKIEKALNLPKPVKSQAEIRAKQYEQHASADYNALKLAFRDIGRFGAVIETMGRDFLTAMPEGAYVSRLGQIAFLYRRMHEDLSHERLIGLLEKSYAHAKGNPDDWDNWNMANLREIESSIRHHAGIPSDLIEKKARLAYEGRHVHRDVLKNNDWTQAQTFLEGMVELHQKIADYRADHMPDLPEKRYVALMQDYMPGTDLAQIDRLFTDYKHDIDRLYPQIVAAQNNRPEPIEMTGIFSGKSQNWLNRALLKMIGFDFERGGLYETGHNPVEGGTPDDTRLVIKTAKIGTFLDSMKSALHEGGHGLYIQGLPRQEWRYQPVGQDLGAVIHESQALLIEMIIGRKAEFFDYLAPRVEGVFQRFGDKALESGNLHALKTSVGKTIDRKSADEVTYFLHIYMRTQLERKLISGDLKVSDLPDAWAQYSKDLFGMKPKNNAEGCLQDVHWFVGKFGYFPSYALGHMLAAQLYETMLRDMPSLPSMISQGNLGIFISGSTIKSIERGGCFPSMN